MEISQAAEAPELDLYTIPSYSNWFQWNTIHEIERLSLREFFDGTSVTRTPRIYKEYRDFIITKYRELPPPIDPSSKKRVLNFTDVRKSLVGDVSVLQKVFTFLEKWGLINFDSNAENESGSENGGEKKGPLKEEVDEEALKERVRIEEGAPYGVRVVAAPNSLKPVVPLPPLVEGVGEKTAGLRSGNFAGLGSYTDVYGGLLEGKGVECESCKEICGSGGSGFYECIKDRSYILCEKCFKDEKYGENKGAEDFKLVDSSSIEAVWSEAEISLLLESVLKHGDDWEVVAQNVKTKSKRECISKLIQLPFGELMIESVRRRESNGDATLVKQGDGKAPTMGTQEFLKTEAMDHKHNENQQNGETESEDPPKKKQRSMPSPGASSLLKQVSHICGVVGPHITASAGEASINALCFENQCPRELFDDDNDDAEEVKESEPSSLNNTEQQSAQPAENVDSVNIFSETESKSTSSNKNVIPQTLRTRAATATALGAAAAHAKILADQEEREMEQLIATVIESQLKKMNQKAKYLEELEQMMHSQHEQMEEVEESLTLERINLLRRLFGAGLSKSKDQLEEPQSAGST